MRILAPCPPMAFRSSCAMTVLLAGCPAGHDGPCHVDSDCGGDVCARTNECLPADAVQMVKVTWTIRSMPADATNCAASPDFFVFFDSGDPRDRFGFEPVPCMAGQFPIDKLPVRFIQVEIGVDGGWTRATGIDSSGMAAFNLSP